MHVAAMDNLGERMEMIEYKMLFERAKVVAQKVMSVNNVYLEAGFPSPTVS